MLCFTDESIKAQKDFFFFFFFCQIAQAHVHPEKSGTGNQPLCEQCSLFTAPHSLEDKIWYLSPCVCSGNWSPWGYILP